MITIDFLDICQNCPDLEIIKANEYDVWGGSEIEHHCTITCEHIDKCRRIMKYVQEEVNRNGNEKEK